MEQVISVHADSATVVLDVLSGQVLRTVDPHSMNISGGHHYTLSPGLVSAIGSDAIVMQNKNSGKMLAWSWHDSFTNTVTTNSSTTTNHGTSTHRVRAGALLNMHLNAVINASTLPSSSTAVTSTSSSVASVSTSIATAVAASQCGGWIVRGMMNGSLQLINLSSQANSTTNSSNNSSNNMAKLTSASNYTSRRATRSTDGSVGGASDTTNFPLHIGSVSAVCISSTGWVASGGQDCTINCFPLAAAWSLSSRSSSSSMGPVMPQSHSGAGPDLLIRFQEHTLPITALFLSSQLTLYSISKDQSCKVWDVPSRTLLHTISFPTVPLCLAVSSTQDRAFIGGADGHIYRLDFWANASSASSLLNTSTAGAVSNTASVSASSALGSQAEGVRVTAFRRPAPASASTPLPGNNSGRTNTAVVSLTLSMDSTKLVSGGSDGSVVVWDALSCQKLQQASVHKGAVVFCAIVLKPHASVTSDNEAAATLVADTISTANSPSMRLVLSQTDEEVQTELSADFFNHEQLGGHNQDISDEIQRLKTEIHKLQEINSKWKVFGNTLLLSTSNSL